MAGIFEMVDRMLHDVLFIMKIKIKCSFSDLGSLYDIINGRFGEAFVQKTMIR